MDGVPAALSLLMTAGVAHELAEVYGDQVVFPDQVILDRPGDADRCFPGWPAPVLVIAHENQGVCSWGVPIGDREPPVLVGGDLCGTKGTMVHTSDVAGYVAARRWDGECLNHGPLLQAQADPLDDRSLARLRDTFEERPATHGWPWRTQYRFERGAVRLLLWSASDQCDWWLSGVDTAALADTVKRLLDLSDLRTSLWSNDIAGEMLLEQIRAGH